MGALTIGLEWLRQMLGPDPLSTCKSSREVSIETLRVGVLMVGLDRLRQWSKMILGSASIQSVVAPPFHNPSSTGVGRVLWKPNGNGVCALVLPALPVS